MTAIFVVAIVVFLIARNKERKLRLWRASGFDYYLLVAFVDLLKMFLVAMVFYHALLLVTLFSGWISTGSLVKLEHASVTIQSYCSIFKIPSRYAFLVLLAVYWLGFATLAPAFADYRKRAKKVYQFVAMLCCFTLLGAEVGPPALTLAVQIRRNRHEYGVLRNSVRDAVGKQVTELLVQRIANGFPTPFPRDVNVVATVDKNIRALEDDLRQIKQAGGDGKDLRSFLKRYPPAREAENARPTVAQRDEESVDADIKAENFADKSYEDIKASRELVQKQAEESGPQDVGLQARKDLTLELFKSLREGLKSVLLDSYIRELPIVGTFHDMLSSAMDKSAKDYIDREADAIAASMPKDQNAMDRSLSEAARTVSASIKVEVTPRMVARCRRPLAEWNAEVKMVNTLTVKAPKEIQLAQARPMREPVRNAAQLDRLPPRPKPVPVQDDSERLETFRRGVESGWIVTRNSGADREKLFVHRTSDGRGLVDLKYLVKEELGGTWTVYRPRETFGGSEYGRRIGTIPRPPGVEVGECTCQ
jgi:hypothetical protein